MEELFKKYVTTEGRLNRWRYFKYSLVLGISGLFLNVITNFLSIIFFGDAEGFFGLGASAVISIAWFIIYMTIVIRRLHDLDKRDLFAIGALIPVINFFFALYLLFVPGTSGTNQYGRDPLEEF